MNIFINESISMEGEIILTTAASYQNRDGILTLSPRKLQWSVQGEKSPVIDTAISEIKNFFVGKPNSAEAKFRIKCIDYNNQEMTHTIVLKSQSAWKDLETIKAQVKNAPSPAPQRSAAASPIHHKSAAPSPASGSSSPAVWNNNLQPNKNGTTTNGRNGTPRKPTAKEINLRKNLLMRDKKLADQHRILVVEQKCITEEEFWELRKNLLRDQDTRTSQQKGRSSTMPNLRPVTEEGGEAKINITPQLINEIFEEYPRVKIAYEKNVPNKISEEAFWKRYVHSKFNDRNRTTSVANDDIFDKCWTETEDDLNQEREHGRKRLKISNLRDLSATREDHIEIDFAPDVTMRSSQGKILSLLRRNNRHGERILETACEKSRRYKEMASQQQKKEVYTGNVIMDDLIEEKLPSTYKLDITDQREYFASQATEIDNDVEMIDSENSTKQSSMLSKFRESFEGWKPNLTEPLFPKNTTPNSVTKKCNEMIEDKQNRARESKPKIENLPQKIEKEVNITQLMGNEFLRHYWASVNSTIKEKVEKNKRMIEQLKSILIKINQISELQPPDDDNNGSLLNGVSNINQKNQRLDKEQRAVVINGKRKISSKASGGNFENRLDSNGSPKIGSEWKDALIQAQQMLGPLSEATKTALAHNQGINIPKQNNRQGLSANRASSPDHNRLVSRDSKTTSSPDLYKSLPRDTGRDIKQPQHHGVQRAVNRESKQATNLKNQKSTNNDTLQSSSQEVQRPPNKQNSTNARQDTNRANPPKVSVRNITQAQASRSDVNREAVSSRTKNIQQNTSRRDDLQPNGRDAHPTTNNVASGSPAQVSSVNRTKSSTKRKR